MALEQLATEEDVSDLLNLYHEYFNQDLEEEEEQPISDALPLTQKQKLNDCGGDFGMEEEAKTKGSTLAISLGYRGALPANFNPLRDRSGLTPWDDPYPFSGLDLKALPENLSPIRLHWHQLAGTHSIVRSILSPESDSLRVLGILIADEVGLGKTAQAISVIAFFMQAVFTQRSDCKLPRIMGKRVQRFLPNILTHPTPIRASAFSGCQKGNSFTPPSNRLSRYPRGAVGQRNQSFPPAKIRGYFRL